MTPDTRALLAALTHDAETTRALSWYATDVLSDADISDPVGALAAMIAGYLSELPEYAANAARAIVWRDVALAIVITTATTDA